MTILNLISAILVTCAFFYLAVTSTSFAGMFLCSILAGIGAGMAAFIIRDWRRR